MDDLRARDRSRGSRVGIPEERLAKLAGNDRLVEMADALTAKRVE